MKPKNILEIKDIIKELKDLGDNSPDLDLWGSIYDSLTPDLQLEISNSLEKELSEGNTTPNQSQTLKTA